MEFIFKKLVRVFHWLGLYFSYNNLNEKPTPRGEKTRTGTMLKEGRCWLSNSFFYKDGKEHFVSPSWEWYVSWVLFVSHCGINLTVGSGDCKRGVSISIQIPYLFSVWVQLESKFTKWLCWKLLPIGEYEYKGEKNKYIEEKREIDFSIHHWSFWWTIWYDDASWKNTDSKLRRNSFGFEDFFDLFLGEIIIKRLTIDEGKMYVPMPEKTYEAKYVLFERTDYRKRWPRFPFRRVYYKGEVDVDGGIPTPGKGENSWDCGSDATYSLSCLARTKWGLMGKMVESVMRDRFRYGGSEFYDVRDGVEVCGRPTE